MRLTAVSRQDFPHSLRYTLSPLIYYFFVSAEFKIKRATIGPFAPTSQFTYTAVISQRAFSPKQQPAGPKFTSSLPFCREWQSRGLHTRPICWRVRISALVTNVHLFFLVLPLNEISTADWT